MPPRCAQALLRQQCWMSYSTAQNQSAQAPSPASAQPQAQTPRSVTSSIQTPSRRLDRSRASTFELQSISQQASERSNPLSSQTQNQTFQYRFPQRNTSSTSSINDARSLAARPPTGQRFSFPPNFRRPDNDPNAPQTINQLSRPSGPNTGPRFPFRPGGSQRPGGFQQRGGPPGRGGVGGSSSRRKPGLTSNKRTRRYDDVATKVVDTQYEKLYKASKSETAAIEAAKPVHAVVGEVNVEAFAGLVPGVHVGVSGIEAIMEQRMDELAGGKRRADDGPGLLRAKELVGRLADGGWVRFKDDAEQEVALNAVRSLLVGDNEWEEKDVSLETMGQEERSKVEEVLLRGGYQKLMAGKKEGVLELLDRYAFLNGSYAEKQTEEVKGKVASLLALRKPAPAKQVRA
ncbi:hypothetical protein MMC25_004570 [Agyrium rufum]|nr:hypothetical protein [Agyrium rufum]